jgi:hypothetical protein
VFQVVSFAEFNLPTFFRKSITLGKKSFFCYVEDREIRGGNLVPALKERGFAD